jgi:hypothetical protein
MALFTDGQINTLQALERYESGLLDVASVEQINITSKMALAQDLIASELLLFLLKRSQATIGMNLSFGQTDWARRLLGVSDVVSTDPLQRWHAVKTMELVYRDAYNNQLNDRYLGKWREYQDLGKDASETLWETGVGTISDPVARAVEPLLVSITGDMPATSYYVRISWINQAGQEGAASNGVGLQTADGTQLVVSPVSAPANATGWNVYVGSLPEGVTRQNWVPLGLNVDWVVPETGLRLGNEPSNGQNPDRYVVDRVGRRSLRG